MRRRHLIIAMAAVSATLLLSACGSDEEESAEFPEASYNTTAPPAGGEEDASGAPEGVELSGTVNERGTATFTAGEVAAGELEEGGSNYLKLGDNYFSPTYIEAEPGETLEIGLDNVGERSHTFTIEALDVDVTLQPGESETVTVEVPESGFEEFVCTFHDGGGMKGALVAAS